MNEPDQQPEISKTDTVGIDTRALLETLRPWAVTAQDIKNEVFQGFLPAPREGAWAPTAVARARRLVRLRARGAHGKSLKLLLFLEDGWGWEGVRDTCITGLSRMALISLNGAERYGRAKGDLSFSVEDIADHQHRALVKKIGDQPEIRPTSNETTAFTVGILRDGTPLQGGTSRRLLAPLLRAWFSGIPESLIDYAVLAFDILATTLDLRYERLIDRLKNATPADIERARLKLRENLCFIRKTVKKLGGKQSKGHSANALTFFGHADKIHDADLTIGSIKLSRTFLLAGFIGMSFSLDIAFHEFLERLPPWLAEILREILA